MLQYSTRTATDSSSSNSNTLRQEWDKIGCDSVMLRGIHSHIAAAATLCIQRTHLCAALLCERGKWLRCILPLAILHGLRAVTKT